MRVHAPALESASPPLCMQARSSLRFILVLTACILPFMGVYVAFFAATTELQQGAWCVRACHTPWRGMACCCRPKRAAYTLNRARAQPAMRCSSTRRLHQGPCIQLPASKRTACPPAIKRTACPVCASPACLPACLPLGAPGPCRGLGGNVVSLMYYAAPLSSMAEVIRTRNSASILLPMTAMNTLNAALWTTYGLAVLDIYIWCVRAEGRKEAQARREGGDTRRCTDSERTLTLDGLSACTFRCSALNACTCMLAC